MKLTLITLFSLVFSIAMAWGQDRAEPDVYETDCGALTVQPITHGSLVLQLGEQVMYVDPYGGAAAYVGLPAPTIILITDIHGDHLNAETLEALDTEGATLVVPPAVAERLPDGFADYTVVTLKNGRKKRVNGIRIAAIPMYNLPETEDSRHPKGRGNGYVLSLCDQQVYISGDTEDIPEMRALEGIDIAFVCMNLPYTMDVNAAADAVVEFGPAIVYPYHYRGQDGLSDVEQFVELVAEGNPGVEVRITTWYPGRE